MKKVLKFILKQKLFLLLFLCLNFSQAYSQECSEKVSFLMVTSTKYVVDKNQIDAIDQLTLAGMISKSEKLKVEICIDTKGDILGKISTLEGQDQGLIFKTTPGEIRMTNESNEDLGVVSFDNPDENLYNFTSLVYLSKNFSIENIREYFIKNGFRIEISEKGLKGTNEDAILYFDEKTSTISMETKDENGDVTIAITRYNMVGNKFFPRFSKFTTFKSGNGRPCYKIEEIINYSEFEL